MIHDVLILGGGIAGVSLAARLAPSASVLLLEGEAHLAYHASGRSAALFEPRYGPGPVVTLSLASEAYFRAGEGLVAPRGMLMVAGAGERSTFDHDADTMALGRITPQEACAMVPILDPAAVAFAAHADHALDIDTDRLIQGFARTARAAGADLRTAEPVQAIARDGAGWRVTTPKGTHVARILVDAAGAWADRVAILAGVRPLGLQPMRRSMARIAAPAGHDVARWPMLMGAGEGWYAKPDAGALIVSPAEEHRVDPHDAVADDMVLAEGLARYEAMVTAPVTRMLANWAGLRTFAPDRVPAIGFDAREPAFFWLAGQGGYGFQSSPAASGLAADLLTGRSPEVDAGTVAALDPARFG